MTIGIGRLSMHQVAEHHTCQEFAHHMIALYGNAIVVFINFEEAQHLNEIVVAEVNIGLATCTLDAFL